MISNVDTSWALPRVSSLDESNQVNDRYGYTTLHF